MRGTLLTPMSFIDNPVLDSVLGPGNIIQTWNGINKKTLTSRAT